MSNWRIRDFHSSDLDGILHLWESLKADDVEPVYAFPRSWPPAKRTTPWWRSTVIRWWAPPSDVPPMTRAGSSSWPPSPEYRGRGIGTSLLSAVENRMAPHGLNKLSALMPESETRVEAFLGRGFVLKKNLRYFERTIPVQRQELGALGLLGGRILARDLWENVAGMRREKELLERRLVLPSGRGRPRRRIRRGATARRCSLRSPRAPAKPRFAKAIASRLEWPFVEVFPSRLAADPKGLAGALRETFLEIAELEHAVVFIDEVEEIASQRSGEPPSPLQGVTNELLKIIPAFREQPWPAAGVRHQLHPCPGHCIPAPRPLRLRHPHRPAGRQAREAMWQRFIPCAVVDSVDVALLVDRTEGFSPADIEFAARSASQRALEKAVYDDGATRRFSRRASNGRKGPVTQDYLDAIGDTRTTVSPEVHQDFLEDIDVLGRV